MKKVFFLATLLLATVLTVKAQAPASSGKQWKSDGDNRTAPSAQEMADKETQRQTKMLNLTPEQVEKVKTINLNYSQQRLDLMKEIAASPNRSAAENKMQGIRLAQDNELKTILTADQQAKLAKAHSNMDEGKGQWKGRSGGGRRRGNGQQGGNN